MSLSSAQTAELAPPFDAEAWARRGVRSPLWGGAILLAALVQQALGHVNCDTSWFMTFADKVLAGAAPYVDVSDPNPPAAFVVYMPALVLAHALHLRPELVVDGLTFAGAVLSIVVAGRILNAHGLMRAADSTAAFNGASFALLVVPAFCFAEREHIVVLLLLPFLAVCAARARGARVALAVALASGVAAGSALAFKPYFLVPFALASLCAPFERRAWHLLVAPEVLAAAVAVGAYVVAIGLATPAYYEVLPVATDIYAAAHERWRVVLTVPAFVANAWLLIAIAVAIGRRRADPCVRVLGAASAGFLVTYLVQAKGWMNHAYPGLAFALLAGAFVLLEPYGAAEAIARRRFALFAFLPALVAAPLLFGAVAALGDQKEALGLRAEVERLAPSHPTLAALAQDMELGHPLVRQIDGHWIGRENCLWISYAVDDILSNDKRATTSARRARLLERKAQDERAFADDVRRGRPDVLLVESPALERWARHEAPLSGLFDPYRLAGQAGQVSIWLRRPG